MINILQTPLLRQLGRRLLLYRLQRRHHQSEQKDNGLLIEICFVFISLNLCCFLLTAVSVPVDFFLLLGFLLLPFFMFLLFLFLSRSIVAGYAVRVLAVVSFSV